MNREMILKKTIGLLTSIIVLSISLIVSYVLRNYLTEYGTKPKTLAIFIFFLGLAIALIAYLSVSKYCTNVKRATIFISILIALLIIPAISVCYPGKITYSRFGLTVCGLVPVPVLDITISPQRCLWFRDKSHLISIDEVEDLLTSDVEILIIGTGWQNQVKVDPAIQGMKGIEIHILSTPDAFKLFNKFRAEGRTIALIAHSTC
jgi:FlaA1/EpsC-like NDP-sugar epimerase